MLQHIFRLYRVIDEIDPKENSFKIMGTYNPAEPLARLIDKLRKVSVICKSGRADNFRRHDGVKMDHPSGTNGHIQREHQGFAATNHQIQDVVTLQYLFPQSTPRTKKIGKYCRGGGVYHGGIAHLRRTTTPARRSPRSN